MTVITRKEKGRDMGAPTLFSIPAAADKLRVHQATVRYYLMRGVVHPRFHVLDRSGNMDPVLTEEDLTAIRSHRKQHGRKK